MSFDLTGYIPHGMIVALGTAVTYIWKGHVKQDDQRFGEIRDNLKLLVQGQTDAAKIVADNHAEVLKLFISAGRHADNIEAAAQSARSAYWEKEPRS